MGDLRARMRSHSFRRPTHESPTAVRLVNETAAAGLRAHGHAIAGKAVAIY
jgi:hypothetical protein